ncbi:MAG: hypothetical protein U0353_16990 [Sandaracinus sp.]
MSWRSLTLALTLALPHVLVAACTERVEPELFVVVAPSALAELSSVVIEARPASELAPCASRQSGATAAIVAVDELHDATLPATLTFVPRTGTATWVTVWGRRDGLDVVRRTHLVTPVAAGASVLCIGLAAGADDCRCVETDQTPLVRSVHDAEAATAACVAALAAGERPRGMSEPLACADFDTAACLGDTGLDGGGVCADAGPEPDASDASSDGGSSDAQVIVSSDAPESTDASALEARCRAGCDHLASCGTAVTCADVGLSCWSATEAVACMADCIGAIPCADLTRARARACAASCGIDAAR